MHDIIFLEEKNLSSSQDKNTPVTERKGPPRSYTLPQTLHDWPWQKQTSPHYRSCQTESAAWFESFKPSPQVQAAFSKGNYSLLAAMAFPRSSHFNLRSSCDMMHAFFALDDYTSNLPIEVVVERCEAARDAVLHVDKPRPLGEHIVGEIFRQSWKRASSKMPRSVIERFEKSWQRSLDAMILQSQHRSQKYICTPEECIAARLDDVGAYPCFALVEQSLELDIPHEVMEHPYMQSLHQDACEMIIVDNDMCSYKKEFLADDADYNTITVVQAHLGTDLEGALQWLLDHHNQKVDNFLAVREKVLKKDGFPSFGPRIDREVAKYVDGIGLSVRGHNEWLFGSARYFGEDRSEVQKDRRMTLA